MSQEICPRRARARAVLPNLHHDPEPDVVGHLEPSHSNPGVRSNAARRTRLKAPVPIAFAELGFIASPGSRQREAP
jgi:hypothetical protein